MTTSQFVMLCRSNKGSVSSKILLKHVEIQVHINGFASYVSIEQIFENIDCHDIEVAYR